MSFKTILIDPPWYEKGAGKVKRGADRWYDLMKTPEIIDTILNCEQYRPDESGCHLYLWVTNNFLPDGLKVISSLGFRYITNIVWVKDRIGLGQYFRGLHELTLFAVMGKLMTKEKLPTVIREKKRKHSEKPRKMYELIEKASYSPRLEMFARTHREGWTAWGMEVPTSTQKTMGFLPNDSPEVLAYERQRRLDWKVK